MMVGGGEATPLIEAPALAALAQIIDETPGYLRDRGISAPPQLWHQANAELDRIMRERGWPVMADSNARTPNFLYRGVPIVMGE